MLETNWVDFTKGGLRGICGDEFLYLTEVASDQANFP